MNSRLLSFIPFIWLFGQSLRVGIRQTAIRFHKQFEDTSHS